MPWITSGPWRSSAYSGGAAIAVACVLLLTAGSTTAAPAAPKVSCTPHCVEHVVVIVLENAKLSSTLTTGAYLDYLWTHYGRATSYFGVCHPSAANYLSMTNGRSLQCGNDNHTVHSVKNVVDLLGVKGLSWAAYQESMPSPCVASNSGEYVARHDPFVSYHDIVTRPTFCDKHVVNSSGFNSSVAKGQLDNYSFYTPNLYDGGHTPRSVADASSWLQGFLSPILNHTGRFSSAAERSTINHTAFLIVYDESGTSDTSGFSAGGTTIAGGHVYFSVVSPYSLHRSYTLNATHYNLDSTVEWLFHLGSDGGYDGTSAFPAMASLFSFSSNGY